MSPFISINTNLRKSILLSGQLLLLVFLFISWLPSSVFAQFEDEVEIPENVVTFQARLEPEKPRKGEHARIILDLKIHHGWHVFSVIPSEGDFSPIPTTLTFKDESLLMIGPAYESNPITAYNSVLDMVLSFHEERVSLFQNIQIENKLSGDSLWKNIGNLTYQACSDRVCLPPKTDEFPLQILLLMTALTVLPSLVLGMTSFTRIIIVMSILRQALGTQQTPPNQVLIAISLFLTFFIMAPTFNKVYDNAAVPYMDKTLPADQALETASAEMKEFMVKNTRKTDLIMFSELAGLEKFDKVSDIPFRIALPAFMTSELKTAFQIGFLLFLPFLVIDMVISSILMSLGMMMLSPMLVALPFKLLLFVLVDGWSMTVGSLVSTFAAG